MARASSAARQPVAARESSRARSTEEDVLLTAIFCLVAFGAVMVYSASSASSVVEGSGNGSSLLIRYLVFAALGFVALNIAIRFPLKRLLAVISRPYDDTEDNADFRLSPSVGSCEYRTFCGT